jgi:hypothetical protein
MPVTSGFLNKRIPWLHTFLMSSQARFSLSVAWLFLPHQILYSGWLCYSAYSSGMRRPGLITMQEPPGFNLHWRIKTIIIGEYIFKPVATTFSSTLRFTSDVWLMGVSVNKGPLAGWLTNNHDQHQFNGMLTRYARHWCLLIILQSYREHSFSKKKLMVVLLTIVLTGPSTTALSALNFFRLRMWDIHPRVTLIGILYTA